MESASADLLLLEPQAVCPYKRGTIQHIPFFLPCAALGHRLVVTLILDLAELELRLSLLCSTVATSLSSKIPSSPFVSVAHPLTP
jgi:hypothetical protein